MTEPIDLSENKGLIIWNKAVGDHVEKDEPICEGEVDKKVIELRAPCCS